MKIGGLQKVSLIDYQGQISAVVFTQGCNFRCPYCHNPELVCSDLFGDTLEVNSVLSFLARRRGKLDAVVVTGGEPTINKSLPAFLRRVKSMGYLIKLDTNGSNPDMVKYLMDTDLLDYIAMDVKTAPGKYSLVADVPVDPDTILKTISIILSSELDYEFRTTVVPGLVGEEDIHAIAGVIGGARRYVVQRFLPSKHVDPVYSKRRHADDAELEKLKRYLEGCAKEVLIR